MLLFPAHAAIPVVARNRSRTSLQNFHWLLLHLLTVHAPLSLARLNFRGHSPSASQWVTTMPRLLVFLWGLVLVPHLRVFQWGWTRHLTSFLGFCRSWSNAPPLSLSVGVGPDASPPFSASVRTGPNTSLPSSISERVQVSASHCSCKGSRWIPLTSLPVLPAPPSLFLLVPVQSSETEPSEGLPQPTKRQIFC